jgi:signal peptidase II
MSAMQRNLTTLLIVAVTIVVDQLTKLWAIAHLAGAPARPYLGGLLTLVYAENSGAFLSLGANLPPSVRTAIFSVGVGLLLCIALYSIFSGRVSDRSEVLAIAIAAGGGLGNLFDRLFRGGHVVDFLYMSAGPLHTGVFNVADLAINVGLIVLVIASLRKRDQATPTPAA